MQENIDIPIFLKWAGGKTQLISQLSELFPKKINRYFEPFLGGGAVFFYILQTLQPTEVILSDINQELITTFEIVRDNVEELIKELKQHKENYNKNPKEYYYKVREKEEETKLKIAAKLIFLNKTCFNGLYRVNSKGKFNVPIGSYKNPDIIREKILRKASKLLQNVKLIIMPFEKVVELAKKEDFVYFDPPYYPLKKNGSFTTYSKYKFLEKEQELLKEVFEKLDKKGCFVMESNSNTEFIKQLYKNFKIKFVKATRRINANGNDRGEINEVVILNY